MVLCAPRLCARRRCDQRPTLRRVSTGLYADMLLARLYRLSQSCRLPTERASARLCRVVRWFLDGCDVLLDVQHVLDERVHALVEGLVVGQLEAALQQRRLVQQLRQQLRLLAVRVRIMLCSAAAVSVRETLCMLL